MRSVANDAKGAVLSLVGLIGLGACASERTPPVKPPSHESAADAGVLAPDVDASAAAPTPIAQAPALVAPEGTTAYAIDQAIDDVAGTFVGKATITFTNTTGAPLASLPLLLHPNASAELGVAHGSAGTIKIVEVAIAGAPKPKLQIVRPTLATVRFAAPIAPRDRVVVTVRYTGALRKLGDDANDMMSQAMGSMASMAGGNHAADYGLLAVGDGILTAASAYPMVAPFRDGSFDTSPPPRLGDLAYNAPATFHVRTIVPAGLHLVTNLVDGVVTALPDGKEVVVSEGSMVRDLVLVAGRDMDHESMKVGRTRVTSYYRARDAAGGHTVLEAGAAALASLERRFGPYPWPELDLAEASIVGGAGGVEFCAMALIAGMFYRPPDLSKSQLGGMLGGGAGGDASGLGGLGGLGALGELLGGDEPTGDAPSTSPDAAPDGAMANVLGEQLEFIVAHEVAHQYFAGIVGNDSRRFATVDEPLAQYAASLAIEDRHGAAAGHAALEKNAKLNYALYRAMGGADRDASRPSSAFTTPVEYAGLVYGKAPFVYPALARALGQDGLHRAIRGAVQRAQFRIVTLDGWIEAVEASAGSSRAQVKPIFRRYLREAHGDEDLHVDDSGDFVVKNMFPGEMGGSIADTMKTMGMKPKDLIKMVFGGGLGGAPAKGASPGGGFDPADALKILERMKKK